MVMDITRFREYYEDNNLDPFKMVISIPGLTRRTWFKVSVNEQHKRWYNIETYGLFINIVHTLNTHIKHIKHTHC